ncbi:tetratricopeptide repeat protein [Candidatus Poribacteria bacterium]|nr:tetratricopeptide repeat protein [Candidatus Poribacteria bacterium]
MRNLLLVTLILLYFAVILGLNADANTHALYVQHVEQAFKSLFQGNNEQAIESFEAALAIEPNHYEILHYLGMSYTQDEYWKKAVNVYRRALELKSDSIEVLYSLGLIYFKLDQWSDAAAQLKQVITLSPNHARGHELLGKVYIKLRQYTDAVEVLTKTLELKPNSPGNYNELGNAYLKIKSYSEAITNFKNAIKYGPPNFAEPHYGLGTAYMHTGEREKSRSKMLLYQQLQRLNVEYERFTRQTRVDPNNLEGWTGLARILMQQKIYNEAIPALQKCIALGNSQNASPDKIAGFHHGLSQAFLNLNYPKHALESVGKAILLSPKQSIFYNTLGSTYARLGLIQKAIPAYQQAIMLDSEQPYYHLNISKLYQSIGNRKLAQEHYQAYEFYLSKQKNKTQ